MSQIFAANYRLARGGYPEFGSSPASAPKGRFMIRLMSFIAVALIFEIMVFGPIGLTIYNFPVRRGLIGLLIISSIVPTLSQRPMIIWQMALLSGIIVFLTVWGGIVPMANGVPLKMSLAEFQPLVALLLILPFYQLFRYDGAEFYLKIIRWCSAALAGMVIVVWLLSNVLGRVDIGIALREFYFRLNDTDLGIYIGPMPDGSFRIMLINFILFPIMLCYYNWSKPNILWSTFYAAAIFATGTRAFLLAIPIIVGVSLFRRRPIIAVPILIAAAAFAVLYSGSLQRFRIFEFSSELESASARYVQFFSLVQLFWEHPIFGAGFGASAAIIRSLDAPYSYELTYVAMLAKLGVVGSGIVVVTLATWTFRLMRRSANWTSIATLVIAIVLMTASNPYLINLVGMTIIAFIIALGAQATASSPIAKTPPSLTYRRELHA